MDELIYSFQVKENIPEDFINKIKNNYRFKKIKISLNNEVSKDDIEYLNITSCFGYIHLLEDTINYYNNIIEVLCDPFIQYNYNDYQASYFEIDILFKEIEITIKYSDKKYDTLGISHDNNKFILYSNCFNTLSELQNEFIKLTETDENVFNKWLNTDNDCELYIDDKQKSDDIANILLEKDV